MRSVVQSDVRKMNSRMLFDLFRKYRRLTRTDISQRLNMTIPSVLKVTQQLLDRKVLSEIGEVDTAMGRKPKQFEFNPDFLNAIGVSFEGISLGMGLVNVDGDVRLETTTRRTGCLDDDFVNSIIEGVDRIKRQAWTGALSGVGIAIPGIVNPLTSVVEFAPLIGIFERFDASFIVERISEELGLEVILENDVNMYAKGEFYARNLAHNEDLICITLGTGIGCGIILSGKLRRGRNYLSGEIGYFVNSIDDSTQRNREGYLESMINLKALKSIFSFEPSQNCCSDELISYVSSQLSPHIANIATLLDVGNIVLGGIVVDVCGTALIETVGRDVNRLVLNHINIERSVSSNPGVVGSAIMVIERTVENYLK